MPTTIFVVLLTIVMIAVLLVGGFMLYVYWWLVQRPTPKLSGEFVVPGLAEPVEVLRDKHGIPHIYAQTVHDLWHAQGYIHAQERLWQMEQNRRIAYGTLAEVFGETALEADRFSRIIGFGRAAERAAGELDAETRAVLESYTAGINALIDARHGQWSAEFNLLRVEPAQWRVADVLALQRMQAWGQSVNWESELTRLLLQQKIDPVRASELEPDYPAQSPIIGDAVDSEEATRLLSTAGLLLNEYEKVRSWVSAPESGMGSNSWVIAPKHSQNLRALLCNDPHTAVQMPGSWFEMHLECPELTVQGASYPGLPGIIIGHNEHVAWGMVNAFVDLQDLYWERAHPERADTFATAEGWAEAEVIEETIYIRRLEQPHVERVVITQHGPLISELIQDRGLEGPTPLALKWVGHQPGQSVRALLGLNRAQDWEEFRAALRDWSTPAMTFTYADADGNIGYTLAGDIPGRRNNLGLLPAPGWDGQHEWAGFVDQDELPYLYNPPSGKIVVANNKMVGDDYHHFLGVEFLPGWRAERIEEMLLEKDRYSMRDMEVMQLDTKSKFAEQLAPMFGQLNSDDPWMKIAISSMRKWNFRLDTDSTAGLIFHYALICLLDEVFGRKLGDLREDFYGISRTPFFLINGFLLRASTRLLQLLQTETESSWYTDAQSGRRRTRDEVLYAALSEGVRRLRADMGDNARRWDWGRVHQVRYVHPLGSVRLFQSFFNRGPFPVGGDATTPNQTFHTPRFPLELVQVTASYRQIYEVGVWDQARSVTTTGQSGHPMSEHYADQMTMWLEGVYHAMPWSRGAVEGSARYRATLTPGEGN